MYRDVTKNAVEKKRKGSADPVETGATTFKKNLGKTGGEKKEMKFPCFFSRSGKKRESIAKTALP